MHYTPKHLWKQILENNRNKAEVTNTLIKINRLPINANELKNLIEGNLKRRIAEPKQERDNNK